MKFLETSRHSKIGTRMLRQEIEFFESDFAMAYVRPRITASILDVRWTMVQLGFTRDFIMEYLKAREREQWISLARQVSPGFQNKGHRRAERRAFNAALELIWRRGEVPIIPISLDGARRISDFRAS